MDDTVDSANGAVRSFFHLHIVSRYMISVLFLIEMLFSMEYFRCAYLQDEQVLFLTVVFSRNEFEVSVHSSPSIGCEPVFLRNTPSKWSTIA